jgi:hypothetical protein
MSKSSLLLSGLAPAVIMMIAFPTVSAVGTSATQVKAVRELPVIQVNRAAKGDRVIQPRDSAARKAPAPAPKRPAPVGQSNDKRQILDGCEPSFSPVVVPTMAHVAGRCIG